VFSVLTFYASHHRGKEHLQIFGALIPLHRSESFWNQDLDPYLQRLYLKYGAAPFLQDAILLNKNGGNDQTPARYHRISANGWRDWVLQDCHRLGSYLAELLPIDPPTVMLVDVGIPTYRLDLAYLVTLCSLKVPDDWRTTFIIIVDNPTHLLKIAKDCCGMIAKNGESTVQRSAKCLEDYLIRQTASNGVSNNIRGRVNATNLGASASRNRALDESSSEYMLFLDDDVIPSPSLLASYRNWMNEHDIEQQTKVLGLIGMVKFPRFQLPLLHAAVLMSYLTFAFEIAAMHNYENPAWGVTANLMVKRLPNMRFDTSYAKTGGGEDVDFCLRMGKDVDGGTFRSVPAAVVEHPFWRGNFLSLSSHFFNWACGDSGLFSRFPEHCFRSWPNASETMVLGSVLFLLLSPLCDQSWLCSAWRWALFCLSVCAVDIAIDTCDIQGFQHRSKLLEGSYPLSFRILSNFLGNAYVIILECGRLWGHVKHGAWRSIGLRFDWHCGRIECHRSNFRDKELLKFSGFVAVLFAVAYHTDVPVFNTYHGQYP
jgi:glycosyltransferase involved in cell wall biosynthesis